ncbi:hypothetical protein [Naasia lichenicola]|uniref:Uncharacterized protein n=1 Tax=Naasia lichenicola TaxID=2565933 RepID=A0A4S4FHD4_9MICO|nr:hypothetical protein [Naasia lichenicola]THG29418.1 hypothetical protein E6C64_11960 [Naasia lichenicola]
MSIPERTVQVLSPVSGVVAHRIAIGGGVLGVAAAVVLTFQGIDQIHSFPLAMLGLVAITASAVYFGIAASPFRAPFTRLDHAVVASLGLGAVALNAGSQLGTNTIIRDDWGPPALALVLLGVGIFRPTIELIVCSAISCTVIASIAVLESSSFTSRLPLVTYALVAITPVLAMGVSTAVLSSAFFRAYERYAAIGADGPELRAAVEATVRERRLEALGDEVLPFLTSVVESGVLTERDSLRARRLASELRAVTVAQLDESWIDELGIEVHDPSRSAERMSGEQRSAIRGLVQTAVDPDVAARASMRLTDHDRAIVGTLVLERRDGERLDRGELAPYIAMVRTFFPTVRTEVRGGTLRVIFAYDA